jgi:hypothetical protein
MISAPSQELIFLDPDDDLATVRAKLESSMADEIYLYVPSNAGILRTPLEFRILGRVAGELSSETIIVAPDGHRRFLARQEGFRTKGSLRQLRHLLAPDARRGGLLGLLDWLPAPSARTGFIVLSAVLLLLVFSYVVLPEMRVTVSPRADTLSQAVEFSVDPNAARPDPSRRVVPARKLEQRIEVRGTVPATGTDQIGRSKALGELQLTSLRNDEVKLPKGTVVVTESGIKFALDGDVTVPPRGRGNARAGISAVEPGSKANVAPRTINRLEDQQAFAGIQAVNLLATSGGTDRETRVVSEQDAAKLREQLTQQARDDATVVLQSSAGSDTVVLKELVTLRTLEEKLDQEVGAPVERVGGRLVVMASGLAFKKDEAAALVGQVLVPRSDVQFQFVGGQPKLGAFQVVSTGEAAARVRVQGDAVVVRSVDRGGIEEALRGKTIEEARGVLARVPGLSGPPKLEVWPTWSARAFRVTVEVVAPR